MSELKSQSKAAEVNNIPIVRLCAEVSHRAITEVQPLRFMIATAEEKADFDFQKKLQDFVLETPLHKLREIVLPQHLPLLETSFYREIADEIDAITETINHKAALGGLTITECNQLSERVIDLANLGKIKTSEECRRMGIEFYPG